MKALQDLDLHEKDFVISQGKVRTLKQFERFTVEWGNTQSVLTTMNPAEYTQQRRRVLSVLDGMGKIHLDFKMVSNANGSVLLFKLPANAPKNLDLIETQVHDGGSVWLDANSKNIYGTGLKANTRYIIDLIGFFGD